MEEVKKPKAPRAKKPKGRGKPKVDSDDESASFASSASSDDALEDLDSESEPEPESESEDEAPRKKKGRKKPVVAKTTTAKGGGGGAPKKEGKKMSESFTPHNRPLYHNLSLEEIRETKEFLHGCGMEGSDDIVDRLVGEQVDKIGGLLQRALQRNDIGSGSNPLQLGTACSGTDAPALALDLVQEQMELRGMVDLFSFTHEFSCENDPFKQGT